MLIMQSTETLQLQSRTVLKLAVIAASNGYRRARVQWFMKEKIMEETPIVDFSGEVINRKRRIWSLPK